MPLLEQTEQSISVITPKELNELSKYSTPPQRIKLAMEAVFLLLQNKVLLWKQIQNEMNNGNFITEVLQLKPEKVTNKCISTIEGKYFQDEQWDVDKIKAASKAISPFVDWLIYELMYIKLQKKIIPKQKEIREKHDELQGMIDKEYQIQQQLQTSENQNNSLILLIEEIKYKVHKIYEKALMRMRQKQDIASKGTQCGVGEGGEGEDISVNGTGLKRKVQNFDKYFQRLFIKEKNQAQIFNQEFAPEEEHQLGFRSFSPNLKVSQVKVNADLRKNLLNQNVLDSEDIRKKFQRNVIQKNEVNVIKLPSNRSLSLEHKNGVQIEV